MNTNSLHESERIEIGKRREDEIMSILRVRDDLSSDNEKIISWDYATEHEDIIEKIDAWATTESGRRLSVQLKFRDRGSDLGLAVVRPYMNFRIFKDQYKVSKLPFDRDLRNCADIYVCLANKRKTLIVGAGEKIKMVCHKTLENFNGSNFRDGERSYSHSNFPGVEIRVVSDRGEGYSGGQKKLICYITPRLIERFAGKVVSL